MALFVKSSRLHLFKLEKNRIFVMKKEKKKLLLYQFNLYVFSFILSSEDPFSQSPKSFSFSVNKIFCYFN